jgi:CRISPR-associated protein Csx10
VKHFAIELNTISPLAVRADHAQGGVASASYIPGSTFLGGLAAAHRQLHNGLTKEFETLFLDGKIQYPNLYPAAFKDSSMEDNNLPIYPVPLTAQSCKRFKGFIPLKTRWSDDPHGVRDTLFDWAVYKMLEHRHADEAAISVLKQHKEYPQCHNAMDHFDGFYRRRRDEPDKMATAEIDKRRRLRTHTGINRERGSVEERILYNRQVFEEDMRFWGEVILPDDQQLIQMFTGFVEEAGKQGLVRLGTGRTRGMGKVELSVEKIEDEQDSFTAFKERLQRFDQKLKNHVREQTDQIKDDELAPFYIALTLHSPLIMCDERLRYYGTLNSDSLAVLAGLPSSPFSRIYQAASTRRVMGWNELWGTPRAHEYAINTGSVFLYACDPAPDEALLHTLFQLEEQGIGRRRVEGFGRVCFSDSFHLEVTLR